MKDDLYWVLMLTGLFLILFYHKPAVDVITVTSNAVAGTIGRLQEGV